MDLLLGDGREQLHPGPVPRSPAILAINLGRGSQNLARHGVLVRHLSAIENLGSMDVVCTDKTGTLTEGVVALDDAFDPHGAPSPAVLALARQNAALQTGLANPLDQAILAGHAPELAGLEKLGEIPYDFVRKRLSVIVRDPDGVRLVTKGAFEPILGICTTLADGSPLDDAAAAALHARYLAWTGAGVRVLGVATRRVDPAEARDRGIEHDLAFHGFLTFVDRPKADVAETIAMP